MAPSILVFLLLGGCDGKPPPESPSDDPHVIPNEGNWDEDREFISPPNLGYPIYACSTNVTITDFLADAQLNVFINGSPAPNPSTTGIDPDLGVNFETGHTFVSGDTVFVTQSRDGATSSPSNEVTATDHSEDYPDGLPQPRLWKDPLHQCGKAILVEGVVPGSMVTVSAEDPAGAGTFDPPHDVGSFNASTKWGHNWTGVNPNFELGARVTAKAKLCADESAPADSLITVAGPDPIPPGSVGQPVIDGQTLINLYGATAPTDFAEHGAQLRVYEAGGTTPITQTPTPGGVAHTVSIPPATTGQSFEVTQELCSEGSPGATTTVLPCEDLPPPIIEPPLPGHTQIHVTDHVPGADIIVFRGSTEIGHSSGSIINLSAPPLAEGDVITVIQKLGDCVGGWVYQTTVECPLGDNPEACSADWPAFRHNALRTARQVIPSPLSDPYKVKTLEVKWEVGAPDGGRFRASPIVQDDMLYIGSSGGHLYAFDANSGALEWQYPPETEDALLSDYALDAEPNSCHNPSSEGLSASAVMGQIDRNLDVVIFGAPDPGRPDDPGGTFGSGLGSGRLFAVRAGPAAAGGGALQWKSGEIARLTGVTPGSTSEHHEQIGYSSPLVLGDRVYVGIANHCDNPIQRGRVVAVDINSGATVSGFHFEATNTRGGGVWTFVSGGIANALVTTTGNIRSGNPGGEPAVNHALAMVRINPSSGAVEGKIQPVPFDEDSDPDWSAGATMMSTSCGDLAVSTMKDGWSYAGSLSATAMSLFWQYPNTGYPFTFGDPLDHGDIRYHRAGAAWRDLYFTMTGGEVVVDVAATPRGNYDGYRRLHALNVCSGRPAWIADLRSYTNPIPTDPDQARHYWGLGPPTVSGGIVFVGTNRSKLLAIADPSIWPALGSVCTWATLDNADCASAGFTLVPNPMVLAELDLNGSLTRTEPVIANGHLYVATNNGRLYEIGPN
ncbi:MAG TPA: PQQ-binding-like beta-propeller repeat protein [Woeseiaceae bacterium]|nr:PQQ-binding-like beta-propeller repeat protein [Woeseiaceae bacterium]